MFIQCFTTNVLPLTGLNKCRRHIILVGKSIKVNESPVRDDRLNLPNSCSGDTNRGGGGCAVVAVKYKCLNFLLPKQCSHKILNDIVFHHKIVSFLQLRLL